MSMVWASETMPVDKILQCFPPVPGTCPQPSPGVLPCLACVPQATACPQPSPGSLWAQCGSHLQLPLQGLHLAAEGLHLRAARDCWLVLQRLLKTEDLLGELCDLGEGITLVTLSSGLGQQG